MNDKLLLVAMACCALAIPACEDNPDQFYKVAPPGAGDRWNNGNTPSTYDREAKNLFSDEYNSSSRQDLCSGAEKHDRWAEMVRSPLRPPRFIAGLDLAGGDAWTGLDFRESERVNCQSKARAVDDPENLGAAWGDANEVEVDYNVATNTITDWRLSSGYRGKIEFKSRKTGYPDQTKPNPFGEHTYVAEIGVQILRDNRPWEINWLKECSGAPDDDCWQKQLTEMYDAMMATFGPELLSTQANCVAEQKCLGLKHASDAGIFGVRPLGFYMVVPNYKRQPDGSRIREFYGSYVKLMPFSGADLYLKLDDEGPFATASVGDKEPQAVCKQHLGLKYGDFLANCVNVSRDQKNNDFVYGKLLGGMSHTKEAFNFSVEAVKLDFLSANIGDDKTVGDDWMPTPNDTAYEFEMDIRASGKVLNEFTPDGNTQTLAGTGAIYREYARRVQNDIHDKLADWLGTKPMSALGDGTGCAAGWAPAGTNTCRYVGFEVGDPHCLLPPGADAQTWNTPAGCTGFEQFITSADHDHAPSDNVARVSAGWRGARFGLKTALKAGDPMGVFCLDPPPNARGKDRGADGTPAVCTQDADCWSNACLPPDASGARVCEDVQVRYFKHCTESSFGYTEKILTASHKRVTDVLGNGKEGDLPPALRDKKFYFRHLAAAIVKYLKAAPAKPTDPQPFDLGAPEYMPGGHACDADGESDPWGCEPEPDHLLFDQMIENSDRDKFEYIDRRFARNGKEPMKVEYEILINTSNQQNWRYHRKLTRPERALYTAMKSDNVRLTNLVGSKVLASNWKGASAEKDAHYCASTLLPKPPPGKTCLDEGFCTAPDPDCAAIQMTPPRDSKHGKRYMLDDYHQPLLTNYRGAFTGTALAIGSTHLRMKEELPFIKSARVAFPIFADPYAPGASPNGAAPNTPILIADWRPKRPGNGIRIPVNEQLDRFVPSATIVFGGSSLTLDLDYLQLDDGSMRIEGVQSDNYMGNVFVCLDPKTKDLLSVEQYESMDVIQAWLNGHPGAREACGIITRFSAFGDYPQLFAAPGQGIVLNVGLGSGVGRITHIELFDPDL